MGDPDKLPELGRYQHKGGGYYVVESISYDSETLEPMVNYRAEQEAKGMPVGTLWTTSAKRFNEFVEGEGCVPVPRFARVGKKSSEQSPDSPGC